MARRDVGAIQFMPWLRRRGVRLVGRRVFMLWVVPSVGCWLIYSTCQLSLVLACLATYPQRQKVPFLRRFCHFLSFFERTCGTQNTPKTSFLRRFCHFLAGMIHRPRTGLSADWAAPRGSALAPVRRAGDPMPRGGLRIRGLGRLAGRRSPVGMGRRMGAVARPEPMPDSLPRLAKRAKLACRRISQQPS